MALGGVRLHVWEAFWANLAPSWRPKRLQNRGPNLKKSMLKNDSFSTSILETFWPCFDNLFETFFNRKMHENCKNIILAETLKIVIFPRENAYFQEIEHQKKEKHRAKIDEKSHVFWDLDFDRIWGGFWEGFGKPKSSIFDYFSMFFRCHFSSAVRKAKKSVKNAKIPKFSASWRRVCGGPRAPGERKG